MFGLGAALKTAARIMRLNSHLNLVGIYFLREFIQGQRAERIRATRALALGFIHHHARLKLIGGRGSQNLHYFALNSHRAYAETGTSFYEIVVNVRKSELHLSK